MQWYTCGMDTPPTAALLTAAVTYECSVTLIERPLHLLQSAELGTGNYDCYLANCYTI